MAKMFKLCGIGFLGLVLTLLIYGAWGYVSGLQDAERLKSRAQTLIQSGYGGEALGTERLELLLKVQDPGFYTHQGLDLETAGAGLTTITQSLAKRVAFKAFKPGIQKIRQTTYAMALENHLGKTEILTLFLDTVPMGQGSTGWTIGFFTASQDFYGASPSMLTNKEFTALISVMIAPGRLNHLSPNAEFTERINRINRLAEGECQPKGHSDVWLEGCAT